MQGNVRWTLASMLAAVMAAGVWAIQTQPAFGPWLADTVRAAVGPEVVARGEEIYYAALDDVNRWRYAKATPASMWKHAVPAQPAQAAAPVATVAATTPAQPGEAVTVPPVAAPAAATPGIAPGIAPEARSEVKLVSAPKPLFPPANFAPPQAEVAAPDDGIWEPWGATTANNAVVYRTQVHPDPARPQAVVTVIAMDLQRLELHSVPGIHEPQSAVMQASQRTGLVPQEDRSGLVAAFNGGWQAIHGHLGMKVGDIELLPPVEWACSIAMQADGRLRIASWQNLKAEYASLRWMRQTPPCLVENGVEDTHLEDATLRWGAALNGRTVVRRSALGINAEGNVLFYALGDSLTSAAIARALEAAGAANAAMLDINQAFPRFVTFPAVDVVKNWQDHLPAEQKTPADVYLATPANKDFFYVRLRTTAQLAANTQ